jgi:transmembrane sensor
MKHDELIKTLDGSRDRFEPRWDDARQAHVQAGLPARARRQRRRRLAVATVAAALALVVVGLTMRGVTERGVTTSAVAQVVEPRPDGVVASTAVERDVERWKLSAGGARVFAARSSRRTELEAAGVVVVSTTARFLVETVEGRVHLVVEEGDVQVREGETVRSFSAGADVWMPSPPGAPGDGRRGVPLMNDTVLEPSREPAPNDTASEPSREPAPTNDTASEPSREPARTNGTVSEPSREPAPTNGTVSEPAPEAAPTNAGSPKPPRVRPARPTEAAEHWRSLARAGDYDRAWVAMRTAPAPRDEPAELLLAADVARLSRHPEQAIAPLTRVLDAHGKDPRAPLAAFTLGRILLDDLGRPREAATAFLRARQLAPSAPLAEDAAAREVEALFRAQDPAAKAKAEAFLSTYPSSPRGRAVRHFGGLP